jgi:hypothetical protein
LKIKDRLLNIPGYKKKQLEAILGLSEDNFQGFVVPSDPEPIAQ